MINCNQTDGIAMSNFITNLDSHQKVSLLLGGLDLAFDNASITIIKKFAASAFGKIYKLHTAKPRELEVLWITQ